MLHFRVLNHMLEGVSDLFENDARFTSNGEHSSAITPSELHMGKLRSTLRQIVRDWSLDGQSRPPQSAMFQAWRSARRATVPCSRHSNDDSRNGNDEPR